MNEILKPTMNIIRNISQKSRLTHNRSFGDFLGDRIIQASTETSLIGMIERLAKLMDTDGGGTRKKTARSWLGQGRLIGVMLGGFGVAISLHLESVFD